jgi:hypothetical protein
MSRSKYPSPFYFGPTPAEVEQKFNCGMQVQAQPMPPQDFPGRVTLYEGMYSGSGSRTPEIGRGQQLPMSIPDWPVQNPNPFGTIDSEKK